MSRSAIHFEPVNLLRASAAEQLGFSVYMLLGLSAGHIQDTPTFLILACLMSSFSLSIPELIVQCYGSVHVLEGSAEQHEKPSC